jgi:hypothetical protein
MAQIITSFTNVLNPYKIFMSKPLPLYSNIVRIMKQINRDDSILNTKGQWSLNELDYIPLDTSPEWQWMLPLMDQEG